MNRYFQQITLIQSIAFLLLWIVGHGIAGYIIFLAIVSIALGTNELWFVTCWSLFTSSGFALVQKLLLTWFDKHTKIGLEPFIRITALLALLGGCLGYLILQSINQNFPPQYGGWSLLFIVTALPPIVGQWWIIRLRVRHSWWWLIAGVLLLASSSLFLLFMVMIASLYEVPYHPILLGFPVCVLMSGVVMLVLINSPRIGKEKRKNEMLTPP